MSGLQGAGSHWELLRREGVLQLDGNLGLSKDTVGAIAKRSRLTIALSVDPGHIPGTCHEPCYPALLWRYPLREGEDQ
jgi:hypothetical protein